MHPELEGPLKRTPTVDPSKRIFRLLGRQGPKLMRTPKLDGVSVQSVHDGAFRARLYRPTGVGARPGLLWIHGGGLVLGSAKQDELLCMQTARRVGVVVVSVEYRLAPEHPFPAALDDVTDAWHRILRQASAWNIDPSCLAIGGASAGGGIAAALIQRLHDQGGPQPRAQWLFAPMLDDRTATRGALDALDHPVWNNAANRYSWGAYLREDPGAGQVPEYAVPARRANLRGLPPAWLCSSDAELFRDEIVEYASRLKTAGVETDLEIVPGGAHGFENWANHTDLAQTLLTTAHDWLAARFE